MDMITGFRERLQKATTDAVNPATVKAITEDCSAPNGTLLR
jgi:hypothetical protein